LSSATCGSILGESSSNQALALLSFGDGQLFNQGLALPPLGNGGYYSIRDLPFPL